jgi:hypothetical protein
MAEFVLGVLQVTNSVGTLSNGDVLKMTWDDGTQAVKVYKNNVLDTTPYDIGAVGSNFNFLYGISSYSGNYATSVYSFCNGTTLNWFRINTFVPSYPYFEQVTTVDSPVCSTTVCDIIFVGPLQVTHSTDLTSNNGQVVAVAQSGISDVKYALFDFDYATEGSLSGTITGLSPGEYTLYAKDSADCTAQIKFTILFKPEYAEHYRITWNKVKKGQGNERTSRVRIYEREYSGDLVEFDYGTSSPIQVAKPKQGDLNNKFHPVHPRSASLSLVSEYDYQFLPLYTVDNKKFLNVLEVDEGSGFQPLLSWFTIPSVYQESFVGAPYDVTFQLTDNVITLNDELYTDDNGNSLNGRQKLIKIIAHIMRKTGLNLNIRCGVNIYEVNHNTGAADDPLDQTYIDVACYRDQDNQPFSCWQVLEAILKPFGARIYQEDNHWIIEEISRATTSYNYRVFDYLGDYVSNGTFNPIMDIKEATETDRVALSDVDQLLEIIPAYGKITVNQRFNYVGSIVSGGFEKKDLLSPESEVLQFQQGVYTTEEGFRDWTLRLNGTTGVNFGRVVVSGTEGQRANVRVEGDAPKRDKDGNLIYQSVGAFYFDPNSWSGNLRDAYIESAAKPFSYGTGDFINFSFDYASNGWYGTYEFAVVRFMIKLGDQYLQQDKTWGSDEYIYRFYPPVSRKLETFDISVSMPDTDVVIDTTIQVRIYYYAANFYDYGLPSDTTNLADGTDGVAGLKALPTENVFYDIRVDIRHEHTIGSTTSYLRGFWELRAATGSEDVPGGTILPTDYHATDNPRIWHLLKANFLPSDELGANRGRTSLERKFYIDNVRIDGLVNGQPPPLEARTDLTINRYINETLSVDLYNFDCPDITNAKNMYNNYFRLANGTPTRLWTRTGIDEELPLHQILLKVLGSNHSAPTFRLTGSFINEFAMIKANNYLRLTKPGSDLVMNNTEFATDLSSWSQTGSGTAFTWTADNSGSAQVVLTGAISSQKIYQTVSHSGGFVTITVNLHVEPSATNDREDVLWLVLYRGASIVNTEKMKVFTAPTSELDYSFTYIAFVPGSVTGVGFFINNVNGTDTCTYQFNQFSPIGTDLQEVYQISDYLFDDRQDVYTLELTQLSKSYISLQGTDQGETNQGGDDEGEAFDGAYSSAYGGEFDTTLN